MLSFLLITQNDGPMLRTVLDKLDAAVAADEDILVIDCGSNDDTVPELAAFMAGRSGAFIQLDAPGVSRAEAIALARTRARHPYLVCLYGQDILLPGGIAALRACLSETRPQALVMPQACWLGAPDVILPAPDASRLAGLGADPNRGDILSLTPDPRRLVSHAELEAQVGPGTDWQAWASILAIADTVAIVPEPVWASPLPDFRPAAPVLTLVGAQDRPDTVACHLGWADDALWFSAPEEAPALLSVARDVLSQLGPTLAADLKPSGPAARLLIGLRDEGPAGAMAQLALDFAAIEKARNRALAESIGRLRADLDLALPGPDYLRGLYDRIRAR